MKLSAVRMIQSAYEISDELTVLDPRSVIMLQLGANVLSQPEVARTQLFGIPRPRSFAMTELHPDLLSVLDAVVIHSRRDSPCETRSTSFQLRCRTIF